MLRRVGALTALVSLAVMALLLVGGSGGIARAQGNPQMKDDVERFALDLHMAIQQSNLSDSQKQQLKEQIRGDLEKLRQSHQNHRMLEGFEAVKNLRGAIHNPAFQPEDQQRLEQDLQQIKEARSGEGGGGMGLRPPMREGAGMP